ncbi:MAG TPA: hypothetical protein VNM92_06205 [Thermoanaerobaculia bacterium]|nr:hypothetical protein [Thermoanaerobaculia bacterium]
MSALEDKPRDASLPEAAAGAILWVASFMFAAAICFCLFKWVRIFPPTHPSAIGIVTILAVSKARDYAAAILFFSLVPVASVALRTFATRDLARLAGPGGNALRDLPAILLYATPFFLAPFFWLTTRKEGWALILPIFLSQAAARTLLLFRTNRRFRTLFAPDTRPFHTLLLIESAAWILFRYIATGTRIAHIPTLFLELVFISFFLLLFWVCALIVAIIGERVTSHASTRLLSQIALASTPLLLLPPLSLTAFDTELIALIVITLVIALMFILSVRPVSISGRTIRRLIVLLILPITLYAFSYASSAAQSPWVDLFHRGESLGPAADYLRGKTPYRDVFVLHGMLDDGLLDAWLMKWFGRDISVPSMRRVVLGALAIPALWLLGLVIFDSIPLALLAVLAGLVTFVDNERVLLEIAVVTLLLYGLRHRRTAAIVQAGVVTSLALFFSLEIGLYSFVSATAVLLLWWWVNVKQTQPVLSTNRPGTSIVKSVTPFLGGVLLGATPFLIYLQARGVLAEFFVTSFVTVPSIIDATWSLPFPDLSAPFRNDLNLRSLSDFVLTDRFRFVLNPLVIAISLTYLLARLVQRRLSWLDFSLATLSCFALVTQRTALGRADFPHQYFSAFLIGPMVVLLLVILADRAKTIWHASSTGSRIAIGIAASCLLPLLVTVLWVPDLINSRLDETTRYKQRLKSQPEDDPKAAVVLDRVRSVSREVAKLVKPDEPIFDFSNQPALYFFADRRNPTRFYQVPILSPKRFELEVIRALFESQPKVVLMRSPEGYDSFDGVDNALRAPAVAAYLKDRYAPARNVRGIEIWERKYDPTPLDLPHYARQMRLPSQAESFGSGRKRAIIPSIANLHGAIAFWQSDLTVHNPRDEPTTLRLRYVNGERLIDRELTLGSRSTALHRDVVATLFESPESVGPLWLEYRSDSRPLVTVRTYDALRPSKASLLTPIATDDAAGASGDRRLLTIAGFSSQPNRRVDLGVVSVGDVPAKFWISAHDAKGKPEGRRLLGGAFESQIFRVGDAAAALGVALTATHSIHIELFSGSAIAFANTVDPLTSDSDLLTAVPSQLPPRP